MGINCLFPYIKTHSQQVNIRHFSGKVAAVDASCWIHKGLAKSVSQTGNRERFIRIFESYLQVLIDAGVKPIVVFDGKPLKAKAIENNRRKRQRSEQLMKATKQQYPTDKERNKLLSRSIEMEYEDVVKCVKLCINKDITYIVSPYESDAQLTYLVKEGYADFAITEDSDLLVYGCKEILVKMSLSGDVEIFNMQKVLHGLKVTMKQFVDGCVASGCDYLKNVRGIGIHKAFSFVKTGTLFEELLKKGASIQYKEDFKKAVTVFGHQTVFNPTSQKLVPLNAWIEEADEEVQDYCGAILDSDYARELAAGNINMINGKKQNSFPHLKMIPLPIEIKEQAQLPQHQETAINVKIQDVNTTSFFWTIPEFPVMTLEFLKVTAEVDGMKMNCLIRKDCEISIGEMICTSHCKISIGGTMYPVLWEVAPITNIIKQHTTSWSNQNAVEPAPTADDKETCTTDMTTKHTLPFKVLGTCHSTDRQKVLEEAFELMENNRPTHVTIRSEPDNPYDENAIGVYLQTDVDFELVGYIASELTKYAKPCLGDPEFEANVKSIRFRTTYMLVGFYLTVELTKKGLWHKDVVKASKAIR